MPLNKIVCPECHNSWTQESRYDTICKNCGEDCSDQSFNSDNEDSNGFDITDVYDDEY